MNNTNNYTVETWEQETTESGRWAERYNGPSKDDAISLFWLFYDSGSRVEVFENGRYFDIGERPNDSD